MTSSLHVMTSTSWGGLELYVTTLIKEMHAAGMPVEAFVIPTTRAAQELAEAGVQLHFANSEKKLDMRDIMAIRRIVRNRNVDVVHSHTRIDVWRSSLALMRERDRGHVHSVYMVVAPKKDPLHRLIYGRVDAIASSSQRTNDKILANFPIDPRKVNLIRYGRSVEAYERDALAREALRAELGIPSDALLFGMIGRIDVQKGVREFAESFLQLPPKAREKAHFIFIGEPTIAHGAVGSKPVYEEQGAQLQKWLKQFASSSEVDGHIHLLDFQKEIVPYYNALDALVLASYAEMYSLSVIDAMAMGLAVIGTNTEGTPEQVDDGMTGLLVEPRSSRSIARAIALYADRPELLRVHGNAGRAWVEVEHPFSRTLAAYQRLYSDVRTRMNRRGALVASAAVAQQANSQPANTRLAASSQIREKVSVLSSRAISE